MNARTNTVSAGCEHVTSRERKSLHAMPVASRRAHAHTGLGTTLNNECPAEDVLSATRCRCNIDSSLTFVRVLLVVCLFSLWCGSEAVGVSAGGASWWLSVTQ
jgi:hypothetical protein